MGDKERFSLGELFRGGKSYVVPPNQRDYSWDKDLLEYFWSDLMNSMSDESYYFGSTIFRDIGNNQILVYDGQQRLASVTILWTVIRDTLWKLKEEDEARTIHKFYIVDKEEGGIVKIKLTLNQRNQDCFNQCIQLFPNDKQRIDFEKYKKLKGNKKLEETNRLLKNCYDLFVEKIEEEFKQRKIKKDEDKVDFLIKISTHLRDHFNIVIIYVKDEAEAYMVFETINQRRLELSVADLFKTYLIRQTKDKKKQQEVIIKWNEIAETLDDNIRDFLKHYWHSKKEVVTERRLFRQLSNYIEIEHGDIPELITELQKESRIYSALKNADDDFWQDRELKELIKEFDTLKVRQPLPLLMIAYEKLPLKVFKELLKLITNFTIRYNIICNLPPNVLEGIYSELAINVRKDKIEDLKPILKEIKKKNPKPTIFANSFKGKIIKNGQIARYIFSKIDNYLWNKRDKTKELKEPPKYEDLTLEHIIPKNMDSDWKNYFKQKGIKNKEAEELIHRLGNQTLLDDETNPYIKNEIFTKKRDKAYKLSILKINNSLANIQDWTKKQIEDREEELLNSVIEIWKIDF